MVANFIIIMLEISGESSVVLESLADAIWLYDVLLLRLGSEDHALQVRIGTTDNAPVQERLVMLVRAVQAARIMPSLQQRESESVLLQLYRKSYRLTVFHKCLDEGFLDLAGLTNAHVFVKRMKKLNTDQVYRQRKYNLLHEETEGYSKVLSLGPIVFPASF